MKKRIAFVLLLLLLRGPNPARATGFVSDALAINRAADSVMMLYVYDGEGEVVTTGSGVMVFDQRTLVTNLHVLKGGQVVMAESESGRSYFLQKLLIADEKRDLVLLRFASPIGVLPLPINEAGDDLRGQQVVVISSPEGYKNSVSKGDIAGIQVEDGVRTLHFTAPIAQGSSGGALLNDRGQLIGITAGSIGPSRGLNFAVDVAELLQLKRLAGENEGLSLMTYLSQAMMGAAPSLPPSPQPQEGTPTIAPLPSAIPDTRQEGKKEGKDGKQDGKLALPAPEGLSVTPQGDALLIRFREVPGATSYQVFRANQEEGFAFWLADTQQVSYRDFMAVAGRTYEYAVVARQGETVSPMSQRVAGQRERPPVCPLIMDTDAMVGTPEAPSLDVSLKNQSQDQHITAFTLTYACEDEKGRPLLYADGGKEASYFTFELEVAPGESVATGPVNLAGYGETVYRMSAAVAQVVYQDGSSQTFSSDQQVFLSWTLE